jgi:hypothetical protein
VNLCGVHRHTPTGANLWARRDNQCGKFAVGELPDGTPACAEHLADHAEDDDPDDGPPPGGLFDDPRDLDG